MRRWLIACLTLLPLAATAGFIQLRTTIDLDQTLSPPSLIITTANEGDSPARSVRVSASLDNLSTSLPPVRVIAPGESSVSKLTVATTPSLPGTYTAIAKLHYTDDNNVPFSAVTITEASFAPTSSEEWIAPVLSLKTRQDSATISLKMLSLTDQSENIRIRLILPDELSCANTNLEVTLPADSELFETFEIDTRHAQPNSAYAAWIILDADSQGQHLTASVPISIPVESSQTAPAPWQYILWLSAITFLVLCLGPNASRNSPSLHIPSNPVFDSAILICLTAFLLWHLAPLDILRDTTTVGGDTPAHNYMASHLRAQLLQHGRIISWADGWWCGFPLFQYYFPLPYLLMAGLSIAIPFNIAFKCVCVLGILALPATTYLAMRLFRLPRPVPILSAILMIPFLFVREHTMWGVNIASTLAGMIANSLSFSLMIPAVASVWRDAEECRLRLRSIFLLTLVISSHFFTSIMAAISLAVVPLTILLIHRSTTTRWKAIAILLAEGALALLLMAWWIIPLLAKSAYSMDFGTNWEMTLWKNFPPWTAGLLPLAAAAVILGIRRGHQAIWLFAWMSAAALLLFHFGFDLSPVFVNCRLWPFIMLALTALGAIGLGLLLHPLRRQSLLITIIAVLILAAIAWREHQPGKRQMRVWAEWNFSGLELKPSYNVFKNLVLPLRGTPGRLANDLHDDNDRLGSSRVFELAPHLAGKPIMEGGLVNSAIGSIFAYYIQSETSENCAGAPPIVRPSSFNMPLATRHLELFNVKHFIARSPATQQALHADPRWKFIQREEQWELFELLSHDGSNVFIPKFLPAILETTNPNQRGMDWIYVPGALDQPFILTAPSSAIKLPAALPRLSETEFQSFLNSASSTNLALAAWQIPIPSATGAPVFSESVSDDSIRFKTTAIGQPHIVKVSYFPNWKVHGAPAVYRVTPSFLLVFPDKEQVELFYGSTPSDTLGHWLTGFGWLLIGLVIWWSILCHSRGNKL
jgi:hypothetical protein